MKKERNYTGWLIVAFILSVIIFAVWKCGQNDKNKKDYPQSETQSEVAQNSRKEKVKRIMTDKYCRQLIGKVVKEQFGVEPEAIFIEWKDIKTWGRSSVAGSFMTDWTYKNDKNTKKFYVKIHVTGDSCEQAELVDATVKSMSIDNHGYSSVKLIYEISDGKEVKIRMKPGDNIIIGGVKVQMAAQHYPVQEFYTSRKLTKEQMQQVWEHEDRDPACNMIQFRLPNTDRHDWYAELEEKSLYIKEANADYDQWYEITKNGKTWSYKRVRL